jgi:hypothetical protein
VDDSSGQLCDQRKSAVTGNEILLNLGAAASLGIATGYYAQRVLLRDFGAWAIYGFMLFPIALLHLIVLSFTGKRASNNTRAAGGILVTILMIFCYYIYTLLYSFDDEDIINIKQEIVANYKLRKIEISEIELIRESPRKLTGFVTIKVGNTKVNKTCKVIMGDDGEKYLWQCE